MTKTVWVARFAITLAELDSITWVIWVVETTDHGMSASPLVTRILRRKDLRAVRQSEAISSPIRFAALLC